MRKKFLRASTFQVNANGPINIVRAIQKSPHTTSVGYYVEGNEYFYPPII